MAFIFFFTNNTLLCCYSWKSFEVCVHQLCIHLRKINCRLFFFAWIAQTQTWMGKICEPHILQPHILNSIQGWTFNTWKCLDLIQTTLARAKCLGLWPSSKVNLWSSVTCFTITDKFSPRIAQFQAPFRCSSMFRMVCSVSFQLNMFLCL